jgi:type IV pilus assembly protein PilV
MNKHTQSGFTLIEVLVALLVLAVGLLGMASLTVHSLQSNQGAYMRSQASVLAYDIAERMRFNHEGATAATTVYTNATATAPSCGESGCTSAQQAQLDVSTWRAALASSMPGAEAAITRTANDDLWAYQITISWTDSGATDISSSSFNLRVDL